MPQSKLSRVLLTVIYTVTIVIVGYIIIICFWLSSTLGCRQDSLEQYNIGIESYLCGDFMWLKSGENRFFCDNVGGEFLEYGGRPFIKLPVGIIEKRCFVPFSDVGKICSSSSDCQGECFINQENGKEISYIRDAAKPNCIGCQGLCSPYVRYCSYYYPYGLILQEKDNAIEVPVCVS